MRDRRLGRGVGGRSSLKGTVSTALLRSLLEAAILVAREGERAQPPVAAPPALRRYLSFARLPDPALEVARRVLDDDEEFRAAVAAAVDEERVGRAGWLFVTRPDGWSIELEALVQRAAAEELAAKEDRAERGAQRRVAGAEAAAARAEAATREARRDTDRIRTDLERERSASVLLRETLVQVQTELEEARTSRSSAISRLKEVEAALATRTAELRAVRHELRMTQAELAQVASPGAGRTERPGTDDESDTEVAADPSAAAREAALAAAVAKAAEAVETASASLAAAAALFGPTIAATGRVRAPGASADRASGPPLRRRPTALPPGVLDDSPEAADHLVRVPGALLLVDGYNVSHALWWEHPPSEQRTRLLDACAELHARRGTAVEVVFDGDRDTESAGSLTRSGVRYRFTRAGVEADDVLLARVDEEPVDRAVLVASSDRRVRDGARSRGANVLGARQVLSVLRR